MEEIKNFPKLKSKQVVLPDAAVKQLRVALDNWNAYYKHLAKARGFHVMGKISSDNERRESIKWINKNSVFPVGNFLEPKNMQLVHMGSKEAGEIIPKAYRDQYDDLVSDAMEIGDFLATLHWETADGEMLQSVVVLGAEGIKHDSMLMNVVTYAEGKVDRCKGNTDCEWWRFGWVWQSGFNNMTRGEVKACLTVVCDRNGRAIDCLTSKHCFMQLGSCDVDINNITRRGNCCRAECAWGVATGTISAKVKITAGKLEVEFSGTFGSESKGGRTLLDCCPARPARPRPGISMRGSSGAERLFPREEVALAAVRAGADIEMAHTLADNVFERAGEPEAVTFSLANDFLKHELELQGFSHDDGLLENSVKVRPEGDCGCG